jgi:hypothetical protein
MTGQFRREELLVGIEEAAGAMDANLRRRVEHAGATTLQTITEVRKKRATVPKMAAALLVLSQLATWESP